MAGDDWENVAVRALGHRYPNFQPVPAQHDGDCGIDGYEPDSRRVFQCYGPADPFLDVPTRLKRQQRKITDDLRTTIENLSTITDWLGGPIAVWELVVPKHDSRHLLDHAAKKAQEVREMGLDGIDPQFRIHIRDAAALRGDIEAALNLVSSNVALPHQENPPAATSPPEFIGNLSRKAESVEPEHATRRDRFVIDIQAFYGRYLEAQAALEQFPEAHQAMLRTEAVEVEGIGFEIDGHSGTPRELIQHIVARLQEVFSDALPALSAADILKLARGATASWILDCRLDWVEE
ncbi:MAG: hypothetical protein KY469_09745 [Actinobacteria bacterium]|nr:hypothetical protein [Actinomycetota bacterium]